MLLHTLSLHRQLTAAPLLPPALLLRPLLRWLLLRLVASPSASASAAAAAAAVANTNA